MLCEWITKRLWDYKTIGNKMDNKWTATQNDYSIEQNWKDCGRSWQSDGQQQDNYDYPNSAGNSTSYFKNLYSK